MWVLVGIAVASAGSGCNVGAVSTILASRGHHDGGRIDRISKRHVYPQRHLEHRSSRHSYQGKESSFLGRSHIGHNLNEESLTIEQALQKVPAKVSTVITAFRQAPGEATAKLALAELNDIYTAALEVDDTVGLQCEDKIENLTKEVMTARSGVEMLESQFSQVSGRAGSLQASLALSSTEIDGIHAQYLRQKESCNRDRKRRLTSMDAWKSDMPLVINLTEELTTMCTSGGGPPPLLECTMPDGAIIPTFKDESLRLKVGKLSRNGEDLLSASLNRAVHRVPTQGHSFVGVRYKRHRRLRVRRHHLTSFRGTEIPDNLCTDATVSSCADFLDALSTFQATAEDAVAELGAAGEIAVKNCDASLGSFDTTLRLLKERTDNTNVALANAIGEQGSLGGMLKARKRELQDVEDEGSEFLRSCRGQLADAKELRLSARKLWKAFLAAAPGQRPGDFVGNCEVTDWVRGPCSQPCGQGGTHTLTRRVVVQNAHQQGFCPPLTLERACKVRPCPVDAKIGRWEEWGPCSRICGGGTRTRRRAGLVAAEYGGKPMPELIQEELCNVHPCDSDCELSSWSDWSSCSKACLAGTKTKFRHVLQPAVGKGTCSSLDSPERRQAMPCNAFPCANASNGNHEPPVCLTMLDLVLVLDGSGSMGPVGFEAALLFLAQVASHTLLDSETAPAGSSTITPDGVSQAGPNYKGSHIGFVTFGSSVISVQDLTTERAQLTQSLAVAWPGKEANESATNTAGALAVARQLFERHTERLGSQPVVVVVTDGPPTSERLTSFEAKKLRDLGVRVIFVPVGWAFHRRAVDNMVSWPTQENVVHVNSFEELSQASTTTRLLANLCPTMAVPSSSFLATK